MVKRIKLLAEGLLWRSTCAAFVFLIMFLFRNYTIGNYLETMFPYFIFAGCSVLVIGMFSHIIEGRTKKIQNKVKENNPKVEAKEVNRETKKVTFNINGFVLVTAFVSLLLAFNIMELATYGKIIVVSETILFIILSLTILRLIKLEKEVG